MSCTGPSTGPVNSVGKEATRAANARNASVTPSPRQLIVRLFIWIVPIPRRYPLARRYVGNRAVLRGAGRGNWPSEAAQRNVYFFLWTSLLISIETFLRNVC